MTEVRGVVKALTAAEQATATVSEMVMYFGAIILMFMSILMKRQRHYIQMVMRFAFSEAFWEVTG